jgi:hypothetical protein
LEFACGLDHYGAKWEEAKNEPRDSGVSTYKPNGPVVPYLYVDAWARLHHDFERNRGYPRRQD